MQTVASDALIIFKPAENQLIRLLASNVDGTLDGSELSFSQLTEETRKRFEVNSHIFENMRFSRVYIDRSNKVFNIDLRP